MRTTRRELLSLVLIGLCSLATARASAQAESSRDDSGGAFKQPKLDGAERARPSAGIAEQLITLTLYYATMKDALRAVAGQAGVLLMYNDNDLPAGQLVTATISDATVEQALAIVLRGTKLRARRSDGRIVIAPWDRAERSERRVSQGSITGRVVDAATGEPIVAATVRLEEASLLARTDTDGIYRFSAVPAGTYTLTSRQIGYERVSTTIIVGDGQQVTADLGMTRSPTLLDQVVTTGTMVPTEIKALPTPITVISADQIAQQHPFTLMAVLRQAVPTSVAFDPPNVPANSSISVRGASSLNGSGDMKIFIDGIEASSFGQSPVDVTSIDRIEVIRGPEAATIYGADAASGVIQIFTKRGDVMPKRPRLDARVSLGVSQTPYAGARHVPRQRYSVSLRGGGEDAGYNVGGGYTRLANYAPNNGTTRQSAPSIYGGMNLVRGIMTVDVSARHLESNIPDAFNPLLSETGYAAGVPPHSLSKFINETAGGRLTATPMNWWRNQLTVGVDGYGFRKLQTTPRHTSANDTLLSVSDRHTRKLSMSLNTTFTGNVSSELHGSLTLGFDHYTLDVASVSTNRALNTSGTIQTVPAGAFNQSLTSIRNTGYFTQLQASVRDAVFLTFGLRAENNTTFGTDYGTVILPRVGASLVRPVGAATLKVRGSYGEAFRAPRSGQATGLTTASAIQLENPTLRPEKQRGWDGGVDLSFGSRASLGISVFSQTARDLIAFLQVATEPMATYQYRNIGRVSNKGLELEGSARVTPWLRARAQYGYVRSRVEETGAAGGIVQRGDTPVNVPAHTAGLAITATPFENSSLSAGVTYVGSWSQTDVLDEYRCLASLSEETCPAEFLNTHSTRVFRVPYPAFAKINATITHRFTPQFEAYVSVDNLTNNESYEFSNVSPVIGRTTMVGLHFTY